ncbi:phage antirepressor protein putative [Clostridium sp. CAG:557]|nr:phage antirepressor protein putative [Clostridium sp. CAG:557]
MMNNLIKINFENNRPTVLGRDLHEALQVETRYNDWFKRMREYGFSEGIDFYSILSKTSEGGRPSTDHQLTIQMAKELCMLQRTEIGKQCRQYFISIEEKWNSPEATMSRALQFAQAQLEGIRKQNKCLENTIAIQTQQISEMMPKASYYDVVLNCKDLVSMSVIAKDYGWSASRMNKYLHEKGVQFRQGDIWLLYQKYAEKGYTSTKTHTYLDNSGQHTKVHTYWSQKGRLFIYDLLKKDGILPQVERGEEIL